MYIFLHVCARVFTPTPLHTHCTWYEILLLSIVLLVRLRKHKSYTTVTKKKNTTTKKLASTRISKTQMLLKQLRKKIICGVSNCSKNFSSSKTLFSCFVLKRRKICIAINMMSNSQEKESSVYCSCSIGNKVKRDETESHRRHKNSCTGGERTGFLKDS